MNLQISLRPVNTQNMIIDKLSSSFEHIDIGHISEIMEILIA